MKKSTGILMALIGVILVSGCNVTNGGGGRAITCPSSLQQCGPGCIPQNAECCDAQNGNSYCLEPGTCQANTRGCSSINNNPSRFCCSDITTTGSYDCPAGQVFCGMFCKNQGEECQLGGEPPTPQPIPETKFISATTITCTFQTSTPGIYDGAYVCTGSVTFDFGGVRLPPGSTLSLSSKNVPIDDLADTQRFEQIRINEFTEMKEVTFNYRAASVFYFEEQKPPCPGQELNGLVLTDFNINDLGGGSDAELTLPKQEFDVSIPIVCE